MKQMKCSAAAALLLHAHTLTSAEAICCSVPHPCDCCAAAVCDIILMLAPLRLAGDDPNYWMALTHQADAKSISKKVKKMLQELNLVSEGGGKVGSFEKATDTWDG